MGEIDFKQLAQRALHSIDSLLRQWLPGGGQVGHEYKAINPTRNDSKIGSFSINITTGAWADFATGDAGGDLISLYAYLNGLDQGRAAREIADYFGIEAATAAPAPPPPAEAKKPRTQWLPLHPVPPEAPLPPVAHYRRGCYTRNWAYRAPSGALLGYICLFQTSDGKETLPLVFATHAETGAREWRWLAFSEPRPLYGLNRLEAHPGKPVLLVEGEKCADIAADLLPDFVIVSWPGGGKAVDKVDWFPLLGRTIYAWADCDAQREQLSKEQKARGVDPKTLPLLPEAKQPGMKAMLRIGEILRELAPETTDFNLIKIPAPGEAAPGWDIADAVAEGMSAEQLRAFMCNVHEEPGIADGPPGAAGWDTGPLLWKSHELVPCLANLFRILCGDPEWAGVLAYNSFAYQVTKLKPPPYAGGKVGEWDDQDDAQATIWLSEKYRFSPTVTLTADAAEACAHFYSFHPVQDYLKALVWDGAPRVDTWIHDHIGAPQGEYIWRVSRWFLLGMVARAMRPGVKFDYCLVLEGPQGRMKSAALRALAGEWFSDTDLDLHNKDSMSAIRGKWLHEFAELGSLARSEASRQKSFLSRQIDEFRPVYGRREIRSPRQLVFAGTTNDWEWNKDSTGGRRFWPVECKREVDYMAIQAARDQLFAEAYLLFVAGERFWPTAEEQKDLFDDIQMRRNAPETLVDMLHDWVIERFDPFSLAIVAVDCLKLDASKMTRDVQTRIGNALHTLGCSKLRKTTRAVAGAEPIRRSWYLPPSRRGEVIPDDEYPPAGAGGEKREPIDC